MWAKLLFLLLYVCVLFLLARFFEAVSWCETGIFASRLVDPVALSLRKLRGLLESRGLSHAGLLEKRGLARLVEDSGDVSEGELYSTLAEGEADVDNASSSSSSSADFTSEMHFYEQVEDTKDGVWLVQISCKKKHFMLEPKEWKEVVKKVSRFGIRTGTFHCSLDPRFCMKRGWLGPSLIMAVPLTNTSKGKVVLKEFHGRVKGLQHILEWVHASVAARIAAVRKPAEFWDEWRRPGTSDAKAGRGGGGGGGGGRGGNKVGAGNSRVKVFLFANLDRPPMFLSAVSVKFTGRVRFIFVDMRSWRKEDYERRGELNLRKLPAYIIQTPEGTYEYGTLRGEHFSHRALDIFLRFLQPEVNDLFVLSLVLVNAAAWMDLFITQGATIKRFVVLISTLGTYNTLLILSWLPIVGLLQLPHLDTFYEYSLKFLRFTNTTKIASWVRTDWMFYSSHPAILLGTYLAHGLIVDLIEKKRKLSDEDDEILMENNLDWLSSLWEYYSNYLFRPIGSFPGYPTSYYDGDLEDGIDVLLERLAVPDLWLRPSISTDYIKYLPTWEFKCAERIITPARAAARTRAPGPGADEGCRGCSASRADDDDDDDGGDGEHSRERGASHVPPHGACPSCKSAGARGGRDGDAARISPVCSRNAGACEREFGRCVCGRAGGGERGGAVSGGWTEPTGRVGAAPAQAESPCGQPDGPRRLPPTDPRVVADSSASDSEVEREVEADWSCWPRGSVRGSECVVCLEAYSLGCLLTCLPCGHAFHARCIAIWLEGGRHCCPVCRWLAFRARPQQAAPPAPPGFTQHAD
ncbi:E3 ubiquitin-protein ligase RNF103 [Petromyzon marinus]|uniref:E3 ubiquitin-protein ligase RNF103 n=1 Tax=Petromyzon marinus TaxID=7757 RepID=UPI003F726233